MRIVPVQTAAGAAAPPAPAQPLARHLKETVTLALPIIAARTLILIMFVVDTIMSGWAGAEQLAFMGLGVAPQLVLMLVAIGALQSVVVMTAQAQGAGDATGTGRIFRAGLLHALGLGFLVLTASVFSEAFFLATGQAPGLAAGAARVTTAFAFGIPGMLAFTATSLFLEATGRARVGMLILIAVNLLNIPLNGVVALGWGGFVEAKGAVGAVAVSSVLRWASFLAALGFLLADEIRKGDPRRLIVPARVWAAEAGTLGGEAGRRLRAIGLPMGLAQGVESAAFATIVFIAGLLGTTALAAHQITMTLVSLIFMGAVGMGGATAIRVGRAVGAGARADVPRAGWTGIGLGALVALPFSALFATVPDAIARIYTDDPAVLAITRQTFLVAATFLSLDAAMGVAMGALRGTGDVWVPTLMQASAFWIVAVPVAWIFSAALGLGPVGLLGGILAGTIASLAFLLPRFSRVSRGRLARLA
ncbi:MATE family efflux transporter [Prosthecomicrobium sp. N25]|uniref:MATE family efflux transporter n=1 Tax=Prosthecomicrobium sp. N25 TaxID=3129254 RepID=UPI003077AB29